MNYSTKISKWDGIYNIDTVTIENTNVIFIFGGIYSRGLIIEE